MKKYLFLLLLPLLLLIPSDTFAKSVSYQDGSMFYSTKYSSASDVTGSTYNYYQQYSSIPWYPLPGVTAPYALDHNALEFILINNTGTLQGRSYNATVVFTYHFDGIYSRLLTNPGDFTGSIIPVGGQVLSSTNTISIAPSTNKNGAIVTINSQVNLNGTTPIDKFTILLSGGEENNIAVCDPRIYSDYYGKNLTCGSSSGNITTQVSLVDFNITVSQDVNTGLLNNLNENQQITNDKLDDLNDNLSSKCENLFNGNITGSNQDIGTFKPNTKYTLSFDGTFSGVNIRAGQGGTALTTCYSSSGNRCTFTTDDTGKIYFNGWGVVTPLTNVMLNEGNYIPYCKYGSSTSKIDETNDKLDNLDGTLKDDDVSGAEDDAAGFFSGFESDDFGLSSIITMPLEFIRGLSSATCYSLNIPLPFVDTNVTLPCMTSIYERYFGTFLTLYQTITTGFIAYGVCINIFHLVQGFKNPEDDNVEVMEL